MNRMKYIGAAVLTCAVLASVTGCAKDTRNNTTGDGLSNNLGGTWDNNYDEYYDNQGLDGTEFNYVSGEYVNGTSTWDGLNNNQASYGTMYDASNTKNWRSLSNDVSDATKDMARDLQNGMTDVKDTLTGR